MVYNIFTIYIILIISSILGITSTQYIQRRYQLSSVRASALLSLVVGIFCLVGEYYSGHDLYQNIALIFMAASFAGMTTKQVIHSYLSLVICGFIVAILYFNIGSYFVGYGGGMGTIANISVLLTLGFSYTAKRVEKAFKAKTSK